MAEENEKLTDIPILRYEDCDEETRNVLDKLLVEDYERMEELVNPFIMAFKEIMNLRRGGKRKEAYETALENFHHNADYILAKRALAWCIYDELKANETYSNREIFMSRLLELKTLKISAKETMIWKNIVWTINAFVRDCAKSENVSKDIYDKLFGCIKEFHFVKPSREYSVLLDAFLTIKEWKRIFDFCEWWNFKNFRKEDYECEELSDGRRMPISLVEKAYLACARALINNQDKEAISTFIPKLQQLVENYPQMQSLNYYVVKLLHILEVKTYSVEEIRKMHTHAYEKWTLDAESKLGFLFEQGWSIEQLMVYFGRNEGGIRSRLRKIGKIE